MISKFASSHVYTYNSLPQNCYETVSKQGPRKVPISVPMSMPMSVPMSVPVSVPMTVPMHVLMPV